MSARADKDESINRMLSALQRELGDGAFDIVDHWEGDRRAIGVSRPDDHGVLIYVLAQEDRVDEYWVSLELPSKIGDDFPYVDAGTREVHGIQELVSVVRSHFAAKNA